MKTKSKAHTEIYKEHLGHNNSRMMVKRKCSRVLQLLYESNPEETAGISAKTFASSKGYSFLVTAMKPWHILLPPCNWGNWRPIPTPCRAQVCRARVEKAHTDPLGASESNLGGKCPKRPADLSCCLDFLPSFLDWESPVCSESRGSSQHPLGWSFSFHSSVWFLFRSFSNQLEVSEEIRTYVESDS